MQCDEQWSFVYKKQRHCDLENQQDHNRGDCWDHVAFDPEHKLVLKVVVDKRSGHAALKLMQGLRQKLKTPPRPSRQSRRRSTGPQRQRRQRRLLLTTDGYLPYPRVVQLSFGSSWPEGSFNYAVLEKRHDEQGRLLQVSCKHVVGSKRCIQQALKRSGISRSVNTSFVERYNGTHRHRDGRMVRRSYRFSKSWQVHKSMSFFSHYSYNFCWCPRTLRSTRIHKGQHQGRHLSRTPAMAAGLTDHVWSLIEWLTYITVGLSG